MHIQKERELFLAHMRSIGSARFMFELDEDGNFDDMSMAYAWSAWQVAKAQAVPEGFVVVPICEYCGGYGEVGCQFEGTFTCPECNGDCVDLKAMIEAQGPANTDLTAEFQTWFKTQPFYEKLIYQYGDRLFDRDGEVYRAQPVEIAYRAYKRTPGNE